MASGTTVSGVDVSGLSPKEAHERIGKGVGDQLAQPVTLTVGQGSSELVPAKSGVSVDTDASVKKLTGFTLNPLTLAQRLGGQRTEAVIRVDSTSLRGALEDRVDTMANGAVSATVTLEGTKPVTTPASNGIGLDVEASLKQLSGSWPLGKKTLAMAEGTAIPAITDEEASEFVDGTLTPLLSSGLTVNTAGTGAQSKSPGAAAAFSPQDTAEMLKISSEGGTLSATFDPTALRDGVVARIGQVETPARLHPPTPRVGQRHHQFVDDLQQRFQFVRGGPVEVVGAQQPQGDDLDPHLLGPPEELLDLVRAALVSLRGPEAHGLGPTPVAVEDDTHVVGHRGRVDARSQPALVDVVEEVVACHAVFLGAPRWG